MHTAMGKGGIYSPRGAGHGVRGQAVQSSKVQISLTRQAQERHPLCSVCPSQTGGNPEVTVAQSSFICTKINVLNIYLEHV